MRKVSANYIFPIHTKPLENGILTIDDEGKVLDISQDGNAENDGNIEFYNGIICPGFVNAHCHLELSYLKNVIPQHTGIIGFITEIANHRNCVSDEEKLQAAKFYDNYMYRQGIVAVGDISNTKLTFELKHESKIFYHTFVEIYSRNESDIDKLLQTANDIIACGKHLGLSVSPTLHAPYSTCDKLFSAIKSEAEKYGILSYHNQETQAENEYFVNNSGDFLDYYNKFQMPNNPAPTGETAIHRLLKNIDAKTKILLIHNIFTSEEDYDFAVSAMQNITWTICPKSNLYIENRLPPIEMLRKKNAKIAIGTDSLSSNTNLSLVDELITIGEKFENIPLNELLTWATLNGAQALGIDNNFGSLEKSKKPSMVLIDNIDFKKMKLTKKSRSKIL
jgi:cytosine/adenosine deaminase-related metal-dependent hydrolase